jgi:hypothetical protein
MHRDSKKLAEKARELASRTAAPVEDSVTPLTDEMLVEVLGGIRIAKP